MRLELFLNETLKNFVGMTTPIELDLAVYGGTDGCIYVAQDGEPGLSRIRFTVKVKKSPAKKKKV